MAKVGLAMQDDFYRYHSYKLYTDITLESGPTFGTFVLRESSLVSLSFSFLFPQSLKENKNY